MKSGKRSAGAVSKSGSREEPYFIYGNTQMTYKKSKKKKIFKRDGIVIKNKEFILPSSTGDITGSSSKYTMDDFQKDIKKEVTDFLRPSFDQIVLLIGAGGSVVPCKAVPRYAKTDDPCPDYGLPMTKILECIKEQLPDVSTHDLLSLDDMEKTSSGKTGSVPKNDLEALLSQFEKAEEFVSSGSDSRYKKTLDKIKSIIREKTRYDFEEKYMNHLALINFFNRRVADGNKLSIVTTNYDTVLEEAAAYGDYTVFDGFTFGDVPTFDAKMFDWNLVKDVPNLETKELIYDKHAINLLKIHGSLTWNKEKDGEVRRVPKETNKSPLLIFPSNNKYEQTYLAPYSDLFYKFRELLDRPRTLLVTVGFSFGDTHIFEMVNDAIRHNDGLSMLFTDYSIDSTNSQNLAALQNRSKEGYRIAFLKATLNDDLPKYLELKENDK